MPKTFFTSDPHLGHLFVANDRGFDTSAEHDAAFAEAWRKKVRPKDSVWVLGDVCNGSFTDKAAPILADLPGTKHLVLGNHDEGHPMHRGWLVKQKAYYEVFDSVHTDAVIRSEGRKLWMSHFPYEGEHAQPDGTYREDRNPEWRPLDVGGWLLHGHVHKEWKVRGRQINVGFDVWGAPVVLGEINKIIVAAEQPEAAA